MLPGKIESYETGNISMGDMWLTMRSLNSLRIGLLLVNKKPASHDCQGPS